MVITKQLDEIYDRRLKGKNSNWDYEEVIVDDNWLRTSSSIEDNSWRQALNTVFWELTTWIRKPSIAGQFHYWIQEWDAVDETVWSGTVWFEESMLKLSTGTDSNWKAMIKTRDFLRYIPWNQGYCFFTRVFTEWVANSKQEAWLYDWSNWFFIWYHWTEFWCGRYRDWVLEDWIVISDFTTIFPTFDPTKWNIYSISFWYLWFAPITFSVMHPWNWFIDIAKIKYPSTSIVTHILNPNLPLMALLENTWNTTNLTWKSWSIVAWIVDWWWSDVTARYFTWSTTKTVAGTSNETIIVFRNKETFNWIENRVPALLKLISASTDWTKNVAWKILKNPPITWWTRTDQDTNNSTLEFSINTTITDFTWKSFIRWNMAKLDKFFEDVNNQNLLLKPWEVAAFIVDTTRKSDIGLSIRRAELF